MPQSNDTSRKLRTVEVVLHWVWDPIQVNQIPEAAGEYNSYALPVLGLLERNAREQEIADYLSGVELKMMGLQPNELRNLDVAIVLRKLHSIWS